MTKRTFNYWNSFKLKKREILLAEKVIAETMHKNTSKIAGGREKRPVTYEEQNCHF